MRAAGERAAPPNCSRDRRTRPTAQPGTGAPTLFTVAIPDHASPFRRPAGQYQRLPWLLAHEPATPYSPGRGTLGTMNPDPTTASDSCGSSRPARLVRISSTTSTVRPDQAIIGSVEARRNLLRRKLAWDFRLEPFLEATPTPLVGGLVRRPRGRRSWRSTRGSRSGSNGSRPRASRMVTGGWWSTWVAGAPQTLAGVAVALEDDVYASSRQRGSGRPCLMACVGGGRGVLSARSQAGQRRRVAGMSLPQRQTRRRVI